jgi:hypothetical protein
MQVYADGYGKTDQQSHDDPCGEMCLGYPYLDTAYPQNAQVLDLKGYPLLIQQDHRPFRQG